jgi:hypothetical protein
MVSANQFVFAASVGVLSCPRNEGMSSYSTNDLCVLSTRISKFCRKGIRPPNVHRDTYVIGDIS